ncbi:uncharacterized protein LOC105830310 isoform X2 [Monomorium pharaonis]|nr:uncharacterized protein LOC105830310 isoform X2 [Monomorium pharaonis]
MAVDNPSYFSLSGGTSKTAATTSSSPTSPRGFSALFRRKACKMGTQASSQGDVSGSTGGHKSRGNASGTSTEERVPMLSRNGGSQRNRRRNFCLLHRSMSTNPEQEKAQFFKGDPRPSDIAPPSPLFKSKRSNSHSEKDHHPGQTRRGLKSTSELLSNDMIFCDVAGNSKDHTHNDDDNNDDDAEVFFGENDARYYNVSSTLPMTAGRRRHSIGTFLGKETGNIVTPGRQTRGSRNLSETDTVVSLDDIDGIHCNKSKRPSYNRNKRRGHKNSSHKGSHSATVLSRDGHNTEDDVVFVFSKESETSNLWVNYLTACFEQISRQQGRPPFRIRHIAIEEPLASKTEERIRSSRLQIVIVCPILLERIRTNPEHAIRLTSHLVTEKVLAMMLGVQDGHISDTHRSSLVSYDQWKKFFVKNQDETFVSELLNAAIVILGTTPPPALKCDKTAFSVHPKKVKLGQNRIIVLLNEPLIPLDIVTVVVDRCGDAIDINNVKKRNPYTLQFSIPERCLEVSMLVGVRIMKNGSSLGVRQVKCESRLRELDQILRAHDNPLEFMCQTFGFSSTDNREQLDNWMVHAFQKNIPPHFNLLSTPNGMVPVYKNCTSSEEYPTLLHFAARFGLEKLAWQLLECPGSDLACDLKNATELTPADLAEQAGHAKLAHQLRGYMQMNEFTNMYSYLKVMSQTNRSTGTNSTTDVPSTIANETSSEKEDYCQPRPLSEAYSVPPIARPITILIPSPQTASTSSTATNPVAANYSIVPTPTPVINNQLPSTPTNSVTSSELDTSFQDYMKMHATDYSFTTNPLHHNTIGPKITTSTTNLPPSRTDTPIHQENHQSSLEAREDNCNQKMSQNLYGRTSSNSSTKSREPSGPQDELLEIINDFKNNVFTISEVERLVENWKKRNDVQQSYKDKQRQLTAMREEYDRIQKKMKDEMRTPTPFDKIRKFFSKKKDTKESATTDSSTSKSESINGGLADRRPVSSLSLRSFSSSSSSGRMSTVSGCSGASLGDSGTHSDSEDRKNVRDEKTGMMSYEIPPAPKPFTNRYSPASGYSPLPCLSITRDLDLRQTQSPSRAGDNEYYIAFPPSGLPVHAFKANGSLRELDTPSSPCEHSRYHDFVQNIAISSDKRQEETKATKHNSYTNIEPAASNFTPVVPPGMCIPDCASNESTSIDSVHVDRETPEKHLNDTDPDIAKVKPPSLAQSIVDEVDSALAVQGQEITETIRDEKHVSTDSANISKNTNEATETTRMPEYMNLAANMGHGAAKVLGAVPKKLPAPPVPPRGTTFHTV